MRTIGKYLILVAVIVIYCIPFYMLISLAGKTLSDTSTMWKLPTYIDMGNFAAAWNKAHLASALINNSIITGIAICCIILVGSSAAYPLARKKSRKNTLVGSLLISCLIVPPLTVLVPLYKFIVDIGGLNTRWAMICILVTFQLPLCIFLYTNFIKTIPKELDEAAIIDGCSPLMVFIRVLFPLLKPVTSSIIILCGVQIWNDYQFSVFFLQRTEVHTVAIALSQFVSQYQNDIGLVAAGCLMGLLPLTLLYLVLQKYFVKGLSDGAVKG